MKFSQKNNKKNKGILHYLLISGFALKLLSLILSSKRVEEIEKNLKKFLHKEKVEIDELKTGKESFAKYCKDSSSIFADYFIPSECNGHRPKILHTRSLLAISIFVLILKLSMTGYLFFIYPQKADMSEIVLNQIVEYINQDRSGQEIGILNLNSTLSKFALQKANDMIAKDYFSHNSPDGKRPWDWIDRGEYKYLYVGENLAMNFTTAKSVHQALMKSPSHKKNIMNERYSDIGLAVVSGSINGKNTNVLVEFFANEQNQTQKVEIASVPSSIETKNIAIEQPKVTVLSETNEETIINTASEIKETLEKAKEKNISKEADATIEGEKNIEKSKDQMPYETKAEVLPIVDSNKIVPENVKYNTVKLSDSNNIGVSPNMDIENNKLNVVAQYENIYDPETKRAINKIKISYYIYSAILIVLILSLIINIIVRIEIQHKPTIIQTLLVILFVGSLIFFKAHFLETYIPEVFVI